MVLSCTSPIATGPAIPFDLLFVSCPKATARNDCPSNEKEIYWLNLRTSELTRFTFDDYADNNPTLSPDKKTILFESGRPHSGMFAGSGFGSIYQMDVDTKSITQFLPTKNSRSDGALSRYGKPVWSPNGRYFAFMAWQSEKADWLMIHDLKTGLSDSIVTIEHSYLLKWSPDSRRILINTLVSNKTLIIDVFTKTKRAIFDTLANYHPFSWSPDGQKIFTRVSLDSGSRHFLAVYDLGSERLTNLYDLHRSRFWPFELADTGRTFFAFPELDSTETKNDLFLLDIVADSVARLTFDGLYKSGVTVLPN